MKETQLFTGCVKLEKHTLSKLYITSTSAVFKFTLK